MMTRLLPLVLLFLVAVANATQLYWSDHDADQAWNNANNWFQDASATTHHNAVPTTGDNCDPATGMMSTEVIVDCAVPSDIGTVTVWCRFAAGGQIEGGTWTAYNEITNGTINGGTHSGGLYIGSGSCSIGGGTFTGTLTGGGSNGGNITGGTWSYAGYDINQISFIHGGHWNGTGMISAYTCVFSGGTDFSDPLYWHLDYNCDSHMITGVPTSSNMWVQANFAEQMTNPPSNSQVNLYMYESSIYSGTWPMPGLYLSNGSHIDGGTFTGAGFNNSSGTVYAGIFAGSSGTQQSYAGWYGGIISGWGWTVSAGDIYGGMWIGGGLNLQGGYIHGGMFGGRQLNWTGTSITGGCWILGGSLKYASVNYRVDTTAKPASFSEAAQFSDVIGGGL